MFTVSKRPTVNEIHDLYRTQKATVLQVVQFFINRSNDVDKELHGNLRLLEELAFGQAQECEQLLAEYEQKGGDWFDQLILDYPLFGVPYNLKDNILVEGEIATSASKIIEHFISPYSATVYLKLKKAGAVLLSKSNLDEWAVGSSTENSAFGPSKNPFDTSRVPGGSSGGPATVVSSGQAVFSLGSDTGGSIRIPAAFCDLVGVKPTYGMISRFGVMPLASSLDQVGPFTNSVMDNILVLSILSGKDTMDQSSIDTQKTLGNLNKILKNTVKQAADRHVTKTKNPLTIGIPKEYFGEGAEPEITAKIKEIMTKLTDLGHTLVEVELPLTKHGLAVYYTAMTAETAANLQRYDGVRYGSQIEATEDTVKPEMFYSVREKYLGEEPKRRIMLGTFASSSGYYDAYYNRACQVKELMKRDFDKVFKTVDVLLSPTTPEFPFKFGEKTSDPVKMYLSDALVYGANLTKIPAVSVPLGLFEKDGVELPTGCQIMAPELDEDVMYKLALEIEKIK